MLELQSYGNSFSDRFQPYNLATPLKRKSSLGRAPNQAAASSKTGLSVDTIRAAKDAGCPAFRIRGDVDCDALVKWISKHPDSLHEDDNAPNKPLEEALKMRAERKLKEYKLAEWQGKYIAIELVKQWGAETGDRLKSIILRLHLHAAELTGQPVERVEQILKDIEDELLSAIQNMGGHLKNG